MPRPERPIEGDDSALAWFAEDLRRLREKAGKPTYRQLSARAHYSAASLSEAAAGRKLPSLAVTLAFVDACDGDRAEWEARWRGLSAELSPSPGLPADIAGSAAPYAGLACFDVDDADRFFGRDTVVADVVKRVQEQRFVGVFGASGVGKSSVLRAGLVRRMRKDDPNRRVLVFTPGAHPIEECAVRLAELVGESVPELRAELALEPENLHLRIRQAMAGLGGDTELLVVVDQFEEVFSLCEDSAEREWFIDALVLAATSATSRTRVVLGVRADFYGHCGRHPSLVAALRDAQVLIGPMSPDELREAITRPAAAADCAVETALVTRLVAEATGHAGVLPLLSHALLQTWRSRSGMTLTLAGYDKTGGIQHAVSRTAEEVYEGLSPARQTAVRHLFLRLTAPGDGAPDTRRRVSRRELGTDEDTDAVVDRLARARLLTLDHEYVEVAHEALIRHWPRLRGWLDDDREGLRLHRQLTDATDTWESLGGDAGALYRGTRLTRALDWATRNDTALTPRERKFLQASRTVEIKTSRRLRQLVALLSVVSLVAVTATVFAVRAQRTATTERNAARAQIVASEAVTLYPSDPELAVQLSLAAHKMAPTTRTRESLLSTVPLAVVTHPSEVLTVAFSPDRRTLATGDDDHTVRLWNVADPRHPAPITTMAGHAAEIYSVVFSPDGRTLASAGFDRTVRLWDVTDTAHPALVATLTGHTEGIQSVSFSPDGRTLASASIDHTVRLWDVADPRHPSGLATLTGSHDSLAKAVFSADGTILAAGGKDRAVWLWDVSDLRNPVQLATITGHTQVIAAVSFSPAGRVLATAGDDQTVRLWDVSDPRHPAALATLTGHADGIYAVAFSPDGHTLVSAGDDRAVKLWDVSDPRHPVGLVTLSSHTDAVSTAVFSPDGRTLATGSWDNTTRLLDTDFQQAIDHACEHVRTPITEEQWDRYFPDVAYERPC
ncbi:helix-turn-helix domain-containing protein [Amycolatopsis sp. NPDC059657]|uniref:nSTAND1 domain-containing NTPase n=1 Tax=Amycolatopsis sp. NPDC059657 TaxID=3346899 RepID=UPI00366CE78B